MKALKTSYYDKLKLRKLGYFEFSGEDCGKWFSNEMLELGIFMKYYFGNEMLKGHETKEHDYEKSKVGCWLC